MTYRIDYLDYGNRLGSATFSGTLDDAIAHAKGDGRRGRRAANCALVVDVDGSGAEVASIRFDQDTTLVS